MTEKELLYVKTIAEEKNITKAAKKLFITQSALSHCVQVLEKELGNPIFARIPGGGVVLTYIGEAYYKMAVDILMIQNDYQKKMTDISSMKSGSVRIGMTRGITSMLLPKILKEFSAKYPQVEIQLKEAKSSELEKMVALHMVDFGVIRYIGDQDWNTPSNIESALLKKDVFCIIAKKGSEYEKQAIKQESYHYPVLDIACLDKKPVILPLPQSRMRKVINRMFAMAGISPRVMMEIDWNETVKRLAESGYGVAFMTEQILDEIKNPDGCSVFSIPEYYEPYWKMCIIWDGDGYTSIVARQMMEFIQEVVK